MTDQDSHIIDQTLSSTTDNEASQERVYNSLRTQVEFYFSPKNLSRDTYLRKMLTSEHLDMLTPRPAQYMCPVGIITNFPKVKDICSQFSPNLQKEPAALLLARALGGNNKIVSISSDGNWIGPTNQILPPPLIMGIPTRMEGTTGQLPPRIPAHYQTQGYHHYQQGVDVISNPTQGMMGIAPPPPPTVPPVQYHQRQEEGQSFIYQKQVESGIPNAKGPSSMGSESPSSTSLESLPQHQQQQAYVSNLPPPSSKISIGGTHSAASMSSMSEPGAKGGYPVPFMGPQGGGDTFPSVPSAPSTTITDHNSNSPPPYSMPLSLQRMYPPLHPWPGGMQYPPQPFPYYHPQQIHQTAMYSQTGGASQPMQKMQAYSAYTQMGLGAPQPPHPQFLAYQGMQQYSDYGGGGMQYPRFPPPPPAHFTQLYENRYMDAPGFFHNNDQRAHHGGVGQRKRVEKKKYNKSNQQQQHQSHQRDFYTSSTIDNSGSKNNEIQRNLHRRGSPSPPIGEHHRGNGGNKFKKTGQQNNSQSRKEHDNVSPSGLSNRSYNRQKQSNHHNDRSLSSDAILPSSSSQQRQRQSNEDRGKEMFTPSDFPGLGGGETGDSHLPSDAEKPNKNLVGYASVLLKNKDTPISDESKRHASTRITPGSITSKPESSTKKVENPNSKSEVTKKEIQLGLQDLCIVDNAGSDQVSSTEQGLSYGSVSEANGKNISRCTSTDATALVSGDHPDAGNSMPSTFSTKPDYVHEENSTKDKLERSMSPVIDVFNSNEFPARELSSKIDDQREKVTQISEESDGNSTQRDMKLPGAWGNRRLFSDVIKDQR